MALRRKGLICRAAGLALGVGSLAWAQTPAPSSDITARPSPDAVTPAAPPRRPLMQLLDDVGAARPLDDLGLNIFGHVEGSYTYNFDNPASGINSARVFDFEDDEARFNQFDIAVERAVDYTRDQFDIGGRVEFIWGADAGLIHSNGLFDWYDGPREPENQWDLNQAYLDFAIPVGNGLRIRAGKFVTLLGFETINPTTNPFYSHSILFGYAIPFTQTGILGTYNVSDQLVVNAGITRGWEQSNEDNNDAVDFLGGLTYTVSDRLNFTINNTTGPQQADENGHWRTVFDFIVNYTMTEQWKLAANADIGYEDAAPGAGSSWWYGIAGYSMYTLNDTFQLNGRAEYFNDEDGSRGFGAQVGELTAGVTITPFPGDKYGSNLKIRPEIRWDYADEGIFDGGDHSQFTAAIEAYFTF